MNCQISYILTLAVLLLAAGCQKDGLESQGQGDGTVRYAVVMNQSVATRASDNASAASGVVTLQDRSGRLSIPMSGEVTEGIFCTSTEAAPVQEATKGTLVNTSGSPQALAGFADAVGGVFAAKAYNGTTEQLSQTVTWPEGGSAWVATPVAYWPQSTSLNFLACANIEAEDVDFASTGLSMEHSVPATADAQKDILLGHYQGNGGNTGTAEIRFEHPLTAVRFLRGEIDEAFVIKSISLGGVAAAGTVTMGTNGIPDWNVLPSSYTAAVSQENASGLPLTILSGYSAKLIGEPFIIIPQKLADNNVTVMVTFTDGTTVECTITSGEWKYGCTNTYRLGYSSDFIDLGLPSGTMWAKKNVGAASETDYGDYYSWGELSPKSSYVQETYRWPMFEKYNDTDHLMTLQSIDDVVSSTCGSTCNIPTKAQFEELINPAYTTCAWTENYSGVNNLNGLVVTSRSNGKSIFLPASGLKVESSISLLGTNGCYWSGTLNPMPDPSPGTAFPACAIDLDFDNTRPDGNPFVYRENDDSRRLAGQSIRPVKSMPYTITGKPVTGCETMGTVSGSGDYHYGEDVILKATPAAGCIFLAWNDGNTDAERQITVYGDETYTAMFQEHYVDFGLASGILWCNSNVGASLPWEKGNYYSYGALAVNYTLSGNTVSLLSAPQEADRSTRYPSYWNPSAGFPSTNCFANAPYSDGESYWTKYNDATTELEKTDDVATVNDPEAHYPDIKDFRDLRDQSFTIAVTNYLGKGIAGVIVYKAKSDTDKVQRAESNASGVCTGPSGQEYSPYNSLHVFFPSVGLIDGLKIQSGEQAYYRSRTRPSVDRDTVLHVNIDGFGEGWYPRNTAFPIRPVKE